MKSINSFERIEGIKIREWDLGEEFVE